MLKIKIICVGKLKENYFKLAFQEYRKRLTPYASIDLHEIKEARFSQVPSEAEIKNNLKLEGKEILKAVGASVCVSLCIEGKQLDSMAFSQLIKDHISTDTRDLAFVIGGSWGLSAEVKNNSRYCLSFSKMTFPHQLFRIMLIEQIYRSFNILNSGKYHK